MASVAPRTIIAASSDPTLPHATPSNPTSSIKPSEETQNSGATQIPSLRKRKRKEIPHIHWQATFRHQEWMYMHLCLITPLTATSSSPPPSFAPISQSLQSTTLMSVTLTSQSAKRHSLDPLTILSLLTPALTSYLGLTGSSIPLDILHAKGRDVWVRVLRRDVRAVQAALGEWTGVVGADLIFGDGAEEEGKEKGKGRVDVSWRVKGVGGTLGTLERDGSDLFRE